MAAVEAFGGTQCGGSLGGVLLGFAEFGDGFCERCQSGDEHNRGHGPVAGQVGQRGQQPGGLAEPIPSRGRWRNTAVGWAAARS